MIKLIKIQVHNEKGKANIWSAAISSSKLFSTRGYYTHAHSYNTRKTCSLWMQPSSSERSSHWTLWSHLQWAGMQLPFLRHWNSSVLQVGGSPYHKQANTRGNITAQNYINLLKPLTSTAYILFMYLCITWP